ncbi:uncharacterized protein SPPG_00885 [Spizellomyces punctatus DAOM BR117]|uniref:glycogenin glucosyltransferase n=1 Tax=Spizellomyces punctatus (strain DAOM BR117) TaxID=645134 RepID=A0A0L0HQL1_SPIPD|nr:uncharacterized protein SPPG_00885 [Spizellomyces punctatus DAOM BR117]KND03397.1 hypothetical protein SPPG_00885 [Spizellomyces punctatus DAOM BR117]|eukprot:XP_016611436.1 hypothetical protein SPPG_00885 [Spizellomyces punctatus DAOM BR117]
MPISTGPATTGGSTTGYPYCTLLTSDSYLPGALVLASSLRATITRHPLVCLVPTNALSPSANAALQQAYDRVVEVPLLRSANTENLTLLGRLDLDITLTKLHVFNPDVVGYERVVFMDADVMVTRNVDTLFTYLDGDVVFAAAPDIGWPDCFNSGVFCLKPSRNLFEGLVRMATTGGSFDGGDQGVLNQFFSSWASGVPRPGSAFHRTGRLPFTFNVTPTSFYSYLPALVHFYNDISAVHFIGAQKPWQMSRNGEGSVDASGKQNGPMKEFITRWWQFYDAVKHVYNVATKSVSSSAHPTVHHPTPVYHNLHATTHTQNASSTAYTNPVTDFSNYRVAWDEREASPVRTTFVDDLDPVFSPTEPEALYPDMISTLESPITGPSKAGPSKAPSKPTPKPISPDTTKSADLGTYRVGWNPTELGLRVVDSSTASLPPQEDEAFDEENQEAFMARLKRPKSAIAAAHDELGM